LPNIKYLFVTETGSTFTFEMQLMQLSSENKDDFTKLTDNLGLYYQIRNDYQNLFGHEVMSELLFVDI
jgi:geranylgeranyl pyrophosphate synthase